MMMNGELWGGLGKAFLGISQRYHYRDGWGWMHDEGDHYFNWYGLGDELVKLLNEIDRHLAAINISTELLKEAYMLSVRIRGRLGDRFPGRCFSVNTSDPESRFYENVVQTIEVVIGPEIEAIDRLWPLLIAKSDLNRGKIQNVPDDVNPELLSAARAVLEEVDRDSTQAVVKDKMRAGGARFKDKRMAPVFRYLSSTGEYHGGSRKVNSES